MAALTARRAIQATLNADRRSARLQAARRHEDELFAGAERLTLTIGGFLRRLRKSEMESTCPTPLQLPERKRRADRDVA
jgi:hypothetical protein